MNIVYILPGVGISGGVAVVLQHANRLKKRGYNVYILNLGKKEEIKWFKCDVLVFHWNILAKEKCPIENIDIGIATHFSTVDVLNNKINTKRKIYFVQSDERRFGLDVERFLECYNSYSLDLEFMTEAIWIQRWLKEEFGKDSYYVPNGLDEKIFYKTNPFEKKGKKPRVLIEGPINFPFKGMIDAYNAVKDLDCELWIISSFGKPQKNWRYNKFFESVSMNDMRRMYSACDVFLKMSKVEGFFGPPLEAMSCGCSVVVGKCTGYDEYIKHNKNALVADMGNVESAKNLVKNLIEDKKLKNKLIKNGYETAQQWSWDRSVDFLEKVIKMNPIEFFYTDNFPEKYNFKETMNDVMLKILEEDNEIIKEKNKIIKKFQNFSLLELFIEKVKNSFYRLKHVITLFKKKFFKGIILK